MTSRFRLHHAAVATVARKLRARHCRVERVRMLGGIELAVTRPDGRRVTVAVRAARVRNHTHHVTAGGRAYHYRIRQAFFNVGAHGKHRPPPDFYVLVAPRTTYVVPSALLAHRLTFGLLERKGTAARPAPVRAYAEAWAGLCGQAPAKQGAA